MGWSATLPEPLFKSAVVVPGWTLDDWVVPPNDCALAWGLCVVVWD